MKYSLKKAAILLAGSLASAIVFSGCESAEVKDTGEIQGQGHEALTIASFNNFIREDFIAAFQEAYPEVKLEVISYAGTNGSGYAQYSLEKGDIPDIYVTSQNFAKEVQPEYLLDLSNYDFVNNYSNALLDSLDIDGSIYLLPSGYQLTGIYYNKTILEENGWEVPQSFEELVALSEQIDAAGYRTMGNGMSLDGFPFNYFLISEIPCILARPKGQNGKRNFQKERRKRLEMNS